MTKVEKIIHGDCLDVLKTFESNSIDSVCCDPPYGLSKEPDINEVLTKWLAGEEYDHRHEGFMNKSWDSFVPHPDIWREVYRVLKPGGHALVFAGTRTQDLMTISLRLAGFEVRDVIQHIFFSGFPKSHNTHNVFKRRYRCELENISVNLVETSSSQNGEVKETDGLDSVPEVVLAKVNDEGLTNRVNSATRNFTLREHIKTAKDEEIKVLFVVTSVSQNGKNSLQARIIRIGKADDSKGMTDISLFTSEEESIDSNTLLSLKKRLGDESVPTKTSITLTELKTIIDLKILSFLQKVNTLDAITDLNHTALKPAHEPIIVVRKPLIDADTGRKLTVVDCVEKYGTGAINIDASRIGESGARNNGSKPREDGYAKNDIYGKYRPMERVDYGKGRFPANCITLDGDAFYSKYFNISPAELSKKASKKCRNSDWRGEDIFKEVITWEDVNLTEELEELNRLRKVILEDITQGTEKHVWSTLLFGKNITEEKFQKVIKSTTSTELNTTTESKTCDLLTLLLTNEYTPAVIRTIMANGLNLAENAENINRLKQSITNEKMEYRLGVASAVLETLLKIKEKGKLGNVHSTVKPVDLMAWLIRLVTPEGGTVLDPFAGSGSTLVAAKREGFGFIGVELTEEYIPIIEARVGAKATGIKHIKAQSSEGQAIR